MWDGNFFRLMDFESWISGNTIKDLIQNEEIRFKDRGYP